MWILINEPGMRQNDSKRQFATIANFYTFLSDDNITIGGSSLASHTAWW